MPKIQYKEIAFRQKSLDLINLINGVVTEYSKQGYELTLRQVYYQLVARGYIENNERSYKNIGNLINDGRLAGLIDWNSITDRTRNLRHNSHWDKPQMLVNLIRNEVTALRDDALYQAICEREAQEKEELQLLVDNYDMAIDHIREWQ